MDPTAHFMILGSTKARDPLASKESSEMITLCDHCPHNHKFRDGRAPCRKGHPVVSVRVYDVEVSKFSKRVCYRDDTDEVCSDFPHATRFERILRDDYPL